MMALLNVTNLQNRTNIMAKTILVIDDKANVRLLLKDYLTEQGFKVVTAVNGREGLIVAKHESPDLVLLDIMMPEMDGYQFMTHYRRDNSTPVIIITAKEEETDAVLGLELGADDYVLKPFRMRELVARIRANLRRTGTAETAKEQFKAGDIVLDKSSYVVTVKGEAVNLTPTEFNLLAIFMAAPEHVFSRESLLIKLEEGGYTGEERTINVHIRNLRTKVEPDPAHPLYIETVFGVGYRFHKPD